MAEACRVATLYIKERRRLACARHTAKVFQRLAETLVNMEPMVLEIDQYSNEEMIQLLERLAGLPLPNYRSKVTGFDLEYMVAVKKINEDLNRFLWDYVHRVLSKIVVEKEDHDREKLRGFLNQLIGTTELELEMAAESTKLELKILHLSLDAVYTQLVDVGLAYDDRHLSLLKKVQVLLPFHRGQDIPEYLQVLGQRMRELLPKQVQQDLDLRIREELENYEREHKEGETERWKNVRRWIAIGFVLVLNYLKGKEVILSFIHRYWEVLILTAVVVVMAYILYRQWVTRKAGKSYDVFLSVKSDIQKTHTEPLIRALNNVRLSKFYYLEKQLSGREIGKKLTKGLKRSSSAIVIFSREFAANSWCLYEIDFILKREEVSAYPIIPIFCQGVTYKDLTFENGESIYRQALENHRNIYPEEIVNRWMEALKDFGGREPKHAIGDESELKKIFEQVANEMKGRIATGKGN